MAADSYGYADWVADKIKRGLAAHDLSLNATMSVALTPKAWRCVLEKLLDGPNERELRMEAALRKIARWHKEFPPSGHFYPTTTNGEMTEMSYGAAFGSNGERDYMRQVALDALNGTPATNEKEVRP